MPQSLGLGSQVEAPLPLVQMRQQHRELHIQHRKDIIRNRHNTPTTMRHSKVTQKPAVVSLQLLNRFQCVADLQRRYGVKRLCSILGVARSSFYY
ncbi:hypothetical protein, partial [Streptomyces sp. NPDC004728]|uniref:hypothetical protein n=1 Tax=Streptomyces sp. NPDC004728 TaxID=3154289 RepID=UPI0033BF8F1C